MGGVGRILLVLACAVTGVATAGAQLDPAPPRVHDIRGFEHGGFDRISQFALGPAGTVYVADAYRNRIEVYSLSGTYISSLTGFAVPCGVAFDHDGNLYVAEQFGHRIQKLSSAHRPLLRFGSLGSGPGELNMPTNLAFSPDGSRLYVTELLNHRVSMFDTHGNFLGSFGGEGSASGQMSYPFGIAVDASGQVFVANQKNHRVDRFDAEGHFLGSWGGFGTEPGQFDHVVGLAFDADENLYATDQLNNRVQKLTKDGAPLSEWGSFGSGPGQMYNPWAVIALPNCRIWVADTYNFRIAVYGASQSPDCVVASDVPSVPRVDGSLRFANRPSGDPIATCMLPSRTLHFASAVLPQR